MSISELARRAIVAEHGIVPPLPIPLVGRDSVRLAIAREVFKRDFTDMDEYRDFIEGDDRPVKANAVNRVLCELAGIGPDLVTIHHLSHPDIAPADETTVLDLDMARHSEVSRAIAKSKGDEPGPYQESLYAFIVMRPGQERMVYSLLYAAGPYLWTVLEDLLFDWVDRRFPTAPGPIETADVAIADIRRRMEHPTAAEKLHDSILSAGSRLISTMLSDENTAKVYADDEAWVYHAAEDLGYEIKEHIVFSNRKAMEKVRIGHFVEDMNALPRAGDRLKTRLQVVFGEFEARLETLASDIERDLREQ